MSGSEFIKHICIQSTRVGEREARVLEVLKHLQISASRKEVVVRATSLKEATFRQHHGTDRRLKNILVDFIKVMDFAADVLSSERHYDETHSLIVDHLDH